MYPKPCVHTSFYMLYCLPPYVVLRRGSPLHASPRTRNQYTQPEHPTGSSTVILYVGSTIYLCSYALLVACPSCWCWSYYIIDDIIDDILNGYSMRVTFMTSIPLLKFPGSFQPNTWNYGIFVSVVVAAAEFRLVFECTHNL